MKKLTFILLLSLCGFASARVCDGKIVEMNHWSDGQANRVNFRLNGDGGSIWVRTTTQEQVSMALTAMASQMDTRVYWSCNAPASCNSNQTHQVCGHLTLINE